MIAYFGCNRDSGHYLWRDDNETMREAEAERLGLPTAGQLDATRLFLPWPERFGQAAITYLPSPDYSVLAWWGSPFDMRGKTNSAIIVSGCWNSVDAIWVQFEEAFPRLAPLLKRPGC
jgi:hypothetical protein